MIAPEIIDPPYYQAEGFDLSEVIEAFGLSFAEGCVVKYITRAGRKPGAPRLQDLRKAERVLRRLIEREERLGEQATARLGRGRGELRHSSSDDHRALAGPSSADQYRVGRDYDLGKQDAPATMVEV